MNTPSQIESILSIATDLTSSISSADRYGRLLKTVKSILKSDAAALLKKESGKLRLLASDGMNPHLLRPNYLIAEHPRLSVICESHSPVIFPADSPLADPFDECLEKNHGEKIRVHSCLGCPLIVDGELVGILSADSIEPGAFDGLDQNYLSTLGALAGATLRTGQLIDALEHKAEQRGLVARELMQNVSETTGSFLLGTSEAMQKLREEIDFAARCDLSVLITGETGTGKELVARSIQHQSARRDDPMIYVNCAALPENIVESELFGHVRGAFTGANSNRAGKFEVADGGTILLDEIGEIPLSVQAKLLRVLQEGEIQRVGSDQMLKVNVRVLAATNRNLMDEVAAGRFRSDLYYRLNVYPIRVPALRAHTQDIQPLVSYFADLNARKLDVKSITFLPETLEILRNYPWPGNVRELRNVIDRTLLRAKFRLDEMNSTSRTLEIHAFDLPSDLRSEAGDGPQDPARGQPEPALESLGRKKLREATEDFQRRAIRQAVRHQSGNWARAAEELGLHRSNLFSLAKRLGLK